MKRFDFRNSMLPSTPLILILISSSHMAFNAIWLRLGLKEETFQYYMSINNILAEPFFWGAVLITAFDIVGVIFGIIALVKRQKT